jgi:hypothetical protein
MWKNDDRKTELRFAYNPGSVNQSKPLIYLWEIFDLEGVVRFRYVGKANGGAERPLRHYTRNVRNHLTGKPYRKGKPNQFRVVHLRLADAVRQSWTVRLVLLCNVTGGEDIHVVERDWHQRYALDLMCRDAA